MSQLNSRKSNNFNVYLPSRTALGKSPPRGSTSFKAVLALLYSLRDGASEATEVIPITKKMDLIMIMPRTTKSS